MTNDKWKTPKWLFKHFKNHFDPCPTKPKFDGFKIEWKSPSFVNPPYSNPLPWVLKAIKESEKGVDVVMLLRVDPSTNWYRLLIESKARICYFNERLKFSDAKGSSNFSSMLVYLEGSKKEERE